MQQILDLKNGIDIAVERAGSQQKLADVLHVSQQYISQCVRRGYCSRDIALRLEELYGISRFDLIDPQLKKLLTRGGDE